MSIIPGIYRPVVRDYTPQDVDLRVKGDRQALGVFEARYGVPTDIDAVWRDRKENYGYR